MVRISDIMGRTPQEPKEPGERLHKPSQEPPFSRVSEVLIQNLKIDKSQTQALYQEILSFTVDSIQKIKQGKKQEMHSSDTYLQNSDKEKTEKVMGLKQK